MERETRDLRAKFKKAVAEKQALELEIKDQKAKLILSEKVADENNARKDEEIKQLRALMAEQKMAMEEEMRKKEMSIRKEVQDRDSELKTLRERQEEADKFLKEKDTLE